MTFSLASTKCAIFDDFLSSIYKVCHLGWLSTKCAIFDDFPSSIWCQERKAKKVKNCIHIHRGTDKKCMHTHTAWYCLTHMGCDIRDLKRALVPYLVWILFFSHNGFLLHFKTRARLLMKGDLWADIRRQRYAHEISHWVMARVWDFRLFNPPGSRGPYKDTSTSTKSE
jgi:hypothetical protein